MRRRRLGILALLLACAAGVAVSPCGYAEEDAAEVRRLLRIVQSPDDRAIWSEAVGRLRNASPETQALLHDALGRLARERHRTWTKARRAVDALAARLGDGRRSAKRMRAWEEARERANAWIFDEERFPVPEQSVITGPMEGYGEAKARGDAAVKAHRSLASALDRALAPALKLSEERARALARRQEEAEADWRLVAGELSETDRAAYGVPDVDPIAWLLLGVRCGDFASVAEAYAAEPPGWRRLCLFHAYARSVAAWNEDRPFDMDPSALEGIRVINAYRLALGISPVSHDEKLARCAFGHSREMTKLGYFSHRSPIPERETKEKRAALEGYTAKVVECITGVGGGAAAVEFWKYDGGHHRDMVDPRWVEAGMSTRGPAVYNAGLGEEDAIPVLRH